MSSFSFSSGLVAVAYLPHGTMILDPTRSDLPAGANTLHTHCLHISHSIAQLHPDLFVLSTPHGLCAYQALIVYQPGIPGTVTAAGNCEWKEQWTEYGVKVNVDAAVSAQLLLYLQHRQQEKQPPQQQIKTIGLSSFAGLSTPLRWGETVPLYFACKHLYTQNISNTATTTTTAATAVEDKFLDMTRCTSSPSVVFLAQPRAGVDASQQEFYRQHLMPSIIEVGRQLRRFIDTHLSQRRVVLLISGDLAHTHPWPQDVTLLPAIYQPDTSAVYRFPPQGTIEAKKYDDAVSRWIQGGSEQETREYVLDERMLLQESGQYEEQAMSCGWTGMLLMQGVMEDEKIQREEQTSTAAAPSSSAAVWQLSHYYMTHPSYYGMMTALFTRKQQG